MTLYVVVYAGYITSRMIPMQVYDEMVHSQITDRLLYGFHLRL